MIKTASLENSKRLNEVQIFSEMLIARGIKPGNKKYSKVTPKGIYKLSPKAWRLAAALENATDYSYDILMADFKTALAKRLIEQGIVKV